MKTETMPNELLVGYGYKKCVAWENFMNSMQEKYPNMIGITPNEFYMGLIFSQMSNYSVQRFHHIGKRDAKIIFRSEKHKNMFLLRWS